jgi:hypothetical protein
MSLDRISSMVALALVSGCDLSGTNKDTCVTSVDCLGGYVCTNSRCVVAQARPIACDPLGAACSDSDTGCFPVGTGASAVCTIPGSVPTNSPCTTVLGDPPECARGNICLNVYDSSTGITTRKCVQYCNPDGGAPSCAAGMCSKGGGVAFGGCI